MAADERSNVRDCCQLALCEQQIIDLRGVGSYGLEVGRTHVSRI